MSEWLNTFKLRFSSRQRRMRVNESGVGLALTGQTPILINTKVTSLGASVLGSTGTIPTLGTGGGTNSSTSGIQSLGQVNQSSNNGTVDMTKIMSGPPPAASVTPVQTKKDEPSSIAVMTHEKRIYSNKVKVKIKIVIQLMSTVFVFLGVISNGL